MFTPCYNYLSVNLILYERRIFFMDNFVKTLVEFVNQIKDLIKKLVESFREIGDQKNA